MTSFDVDVAASGDDGNVSSFSVFSNARLKIGDDSFVSGDLYSSFVRFDSVGIPQGETIDDNNSTPANIPNLSGDYGAGGGAGAGAKRFLLLGVG